MLFKRWLEQNQLPEQDQPASDREIRRQVFHNPTALKRIKDIKQSGFAQDIRKYVPAGSTFKAAGSEAIVATTPSGEILKISRAQNTPENPYLLQPNWQTMVGPWRIERLPNATLTPQVDPSEWRPAMNKLKSDTEAQGGTVKDWGPDQIGKVDGKWWVIDRGV